MANYYVDENYYSNTFSGVVIPQDSFYTYEAKAARYIDYVTFGRAKDNVCDEVKNAVCAVAEVYYLDDQRPRGIKSENADGYSATYDDKQIESEAYRAARQMLSGTGLMYLGV